MDLVPPPSDDYPEVLSDVIDAILSRGLSAGAEALAPIAFVRRDVQRRPSMSRSLQGEVYRRDRFTCRYCGGRLIPTPVMELIGELYPDDFPFHPNWKGGQTHPAILSRSPVVDHVEPGSLGGDWARLDNLVTACWPCNGRKADFSLEQLGWQIRAVPQGEEWDGLTSTYADLWRAAGLPKPAYHRAWMKALGCSQDLE